MPEQPDVGAIEAVYQFQFTDQERMLLTQTNNALLDPYEQQHRHILIMATRGVSCPGCHGLICRRVACQVPERFLGNESIPDDSYQCPFCQARLEWHIDVIGAEWFTLAPGQTIHVPPSPGGPTVG